MGYPRHKNYKEGDMGMYHCTVRCVRRAFLCGRDPVTKRSYEHRREWIRSRLSFLVQLFAIEVVAYAVMSNHLHTILRTRPDIAIHWTPREVAERWLMLFPPKNLKKIPMQHFIDEIVNDELRVQKLRIRLQSLSWFNKTMNENIAKRANEEEESSGHFWEARFYAQKILDIPSAIACSVYVDLNPIRAKMAISPETSNYTSVQERINQCQGRAPIVPLVSVQEAFKNRLSLADYLLLVDITGRLIVQGKASIPDELAPILERLQIPKDTWLFTSQNFKSLFKRVVGSKLAMQLESEKLGQKLFGLNNAAVAFGG